MKIQIKFRYWNKKAEQMGSWDDIEVLDADGIMPFLDIIKDTERYVIMPYTGLNDRHGNEIYEGDIILAGLERCKVEWRQEICAFACISPFNGSYIWLGSAYQDNIEKLGNIYENPELIESNESARAEK